MASLYSSWKSRRFGTFPLHLPPARPDSGASQKRPPETSVPWAANERLPNAPGSM